MGQQLEIDPMQPKPTRLLRDAAAARQNRARLMLPRAKPLKEQLARVVYRSPAAITGSTW